MKAQHNIAIRFNKFTSINRMPRTLDSLPAFLAATGVKPQSQLGYLTHIKRELTVTPLDMYAKGLRRTMTPPEQAHPITWEQMERFILSRPTIKEASAAFLAWKTASRWDDVRGLTIAHVKLLSPNRIVIHFGTNTKTSQDNAFEISHLVDIVPGPHDTHHFPRLVAVLSVMKPNQAITWTPTEKIAAALKKIHPSLTAHSIKAGAIAVLMQAAAMDVFPVELVGRLAKHKNQNAPLTSSTVRYARSLPDLAAALHTAKCTTVL